LVSKIVYDIFLINNYVRFQAVIDKDNELIEKLLSDGNFDEAGSVYEKGAFSRSNALLHFHGATLPGDIKANSLVTGTAINGESVTGTIIEPKSRGTKSVHVFYESNLGLGSCYVGGSPEPVLEGCKFNNNSYASIDCSIHLLTLLRETVSRFCGIRKNYLRRVRGYSSSLPLQRIR
jgi:hypothetical protein